MISSNVEGSKTCGAQRPASYKTDMQGVGYRSTPLLPFLCTLLHLILLDRVQHELIRMSRSIA